MRKRIIALVEDDPIIRENYTDVLESEGFVVHAYADRESAAQGCMQQMPDLALLDVALGDDQEGGFTLCAQLRRAAPQLPIIFLTSFSSEVDKISGMRLGADDYLTKDSSMEFVVIRIRALFRRLATFGVLADTRNVLESGLMLDDEKQTARWQGRLVSLSVTQYWLVRALYRARGRVMSALELMQAAKLTVEPNTIVAHINAVRAKFREVDPAFDSLRTARGVGYRWLE